MKIDRETILKIAHLARLEVHEPEIEPISKDLARILGFMEKLNELDTSNVEPLVYMTDEYNILRRDEVIHEINHEEALLNAPQKDSDYFRVPKVIEQ